MVPSMPHFWANRSSDPQRHSHLHRHGRRRTPGQEEGASARKSRKSEWVVATVPMGEDELHHEKGRGRERWCSCSSLCSVKSSQCRSVLSAPPRFSSQGSTSGEWGRGKSSKNELRNYQSFFSVLQNLPQTRSLPPCEAWKQASTLSTPRPPCRVWPGHQYQQFSGSLQSSSSSSVVAPRQPDRKGSDREQKIWEIYAYL